MKVNCTGKEKIGYKFIGKYNAIKIQVKVMWRLK